MPALEPIYWTADMVRALPDDGKRYETLFGELVVTPAPAGPHQLAVQRLHIALALYERAVPAMGATFLSPADISWAEDVLVQPDLFVVQREQARTLKWASMQDLRLAIEVLSPSTARTDRYKKRSLYQRFGVGETWLVDTEHGCIERWTPSATRPVIEGNTLVWAPVAGAPAFTLEVASLFAPLE
jgi:Uma2 family endonuclease